MRIPKTFLAAILLLGSAWAAGEDGLRPLMDCHQHLFSPTAAKLSGITPVTAKDLVPLLDAAGIRRALVLSVAYQYSNPNKPRVANEYALVKAENDWTSHEVAAFPDRFRGFCGINPLADYAVTEIERCAKDPNLHFGLKLHFGNSDVDLTNPEHVEKLRRVFRLANAHRMAVVVHLRPSISKQRPYGARQSQIFLERVLPAAPDVPIQIAHLAGAGGYDDPEIDEALMVFVRAISNRDPSMDKVYFDVSGVAGLGAWRDKADLIAARIRQLGVARVFYGSDGAVGENTPINAWSAFRQLPLSDAEFREIAGNIPPYFRTASDPPKVTGPMLSALPPDASHLLSGNELKAARASVPYQRFADWLDAFNTGDRSRIAAFLASTWPSRNVEQEMAMRARSGGFEMRAIREATPTSLSGFVESPDSDDFASFNVTVEPGGAHRITNMTLRLMPRPPGFEVPRMSEADLIAGLRARLEKDSAAERFSGTMLVTKQGRTLFSGAYGLADRDMKVPNTLDTRFRIGSMNKMFTGTAILQLVQAGKIELTAPLGKYLPNYPNQAVATKVTIHQLLTHTGGTGDIFGPEFDAHRLELRTLDDYVSLYGKRDLLFEPGSRFQYSNYGMLLLGVVIERVSGMNYYDYVAQNIFKPAGMTRTGSEPESEDVLGRSIGYTQAPTSTGWLPNTATLPYRGTSAGGGYSTVGDLVKFAEALLSHELLDAAHTELLITGKTSTPGGPARYAYGFEDDRHPDGWGAVGHGGGAPGMNGELRIFPASGHVVAVLANLDPPAAQRAWMFVELRLEREIAR